MFSRVVAGLALLFAMGNARACEVADRPISEAALAARARNALDTSPYLYEGIILKEPDFDRTGLFLVIRVHKGTAPAYRLATIPRAGGCIGALGPSGIGDLGFLRDHTADGTGFNGLELSDVVASWERHGMIDTLRITWEMVGTALVGAAVVSALAAKRLTRAKRKGSGHEDP